MNEYVYGEGVVVRNEETLAPPPPHTHTFVDVRFIAYNKNPDNNTKNSESYKHKVNVHVIIKLSMYLHAMSRERASLTCGLSCKACRRVRKASLYSPN
jgi:hypothetical protein